MEKLKLIVIHIFKKFISFSIKNPILKLKDFIFIYIKEVLKNFNKHDGELSTCALAFYLLISFIPISLVVISILSFFYKTSDMSAYYLTQLKTQLPSIDINYILKMIDKIVYNKRYHAFIWIPFLFWWGSFMFDIIERALEKAFYIEESRKYWKAKIRHFIIILGMGFSAVALTFISNIIAIMKNSEIIDFIQLHLKNVPFIYHLFISVGNIPFFLSSATTLVLNSIIIFMIYRFVPPKKIDNRSLFEGAFFSAVLYEIVKIIFSYYITQINDYSSIFGSLNTLVILMIWIWYTCFLLIVGAEMAWVIFEKKNNLVQTV